MNVDHGDLDTLRAAIAELSTSFGALEKNGAERLALQANVKAANEAVVKAADEIQKFLVLVLNVSKTEFETAVSSLATTDAKARKAAAEKIIETQKTIKTLKVMQDELRGLISNIVEGSIVGDQRHYQPYQ